MQPTSTLPEYWFIFQNGCLAFLKQPHQLVLPQTNDLFKSQIIRQYHLGNFNEVACHCAEIKNTTDILFIHIVFIPLRKALEMLEGEWYGIAAKAYSIIQWDKNHRYCGRCGELTEHKTGSFERICHTCQLAHFPRISPSVILLIKKQDHLLMARSPHFPPNVYGLIAGFIEVGESIEEAIHREVKEEIGITVKNCQYFGSQSWPFPDSLMIGFIADYAAGELIINQDEIEAAGWYRFDHLPGRPSTSISIAAKLINHFITEQQS